jgi:hypothetical protein
VAQPFQDFVNAALEILYLTDTRVTDAGLAHLHSLVDLQFLDLRGTTVTDAGVAELRKRLLKARIMLP